MMGRELLLSSTNNTALISFEDLPIALDGIPNGYLEIKKGTSLRSYGIEELNFPKSSTYWANAGFSSVTASGSISDFSVDTIVNSDLTVSPKHICNVFPANRTLSISLTVTPAQYTRDAAGNQFYYYGADSYHNFGSLSITSNDLEIWSTEPEYAKQFYTSTNWLGNGDFELYLRFRGKTEAMRGVRSGTKCTYLSPNISFRNTSNTPTMTKEDIRVITSFLDDGYFTVRGDIYVRINPATYIKWSSGNTYTIKLLTA